MRINVTPTCRAHASPPSSPSSSVFPPTSPDITDARCPFGIANFVVTVTTSFAANGKVDTRLPAASQSQGATDQSPAEVQPLTIVSINRDHLVQKG